MIQLSQANYNYVLETEKPIIIDFYTTWCAPCRAIEPTFKEWSIKHADKASFAKCDAEESTEIAQKYNISSLPTFVVIRNGIEVKRFVGAPKEDELMQAVK